MRGYLLDTNVVSELGRPAPDANVIQWMQDVPDDDLYLSSLVAGEIRYGIELLRPRAPKRAATLEHWSDELQSLFPDRVLPVTTEISTMWGRLNATRPLPTIDGFLAATALVHDLTLATRNVGDMQGLGVSLVDPWQHPVPPPAVRRATRPRTAGR